MRSETAPQRNSNTHCDGTLVFIKYLKQFVIMQSVFSAAARRMTSPERFAQGRAAPVR
jgi:hypothetical protein